MKRLALAALIFAASPLVAQQTGVARPADTLDDVPASVPVVTAPVVVVAPPAAPTAQDSSPAVTLQRRDLAKFAPDPAQIATTEDTSGDIVEEGPQRPGELPAGTLIRVRLHGAIDTATTSPETPFSALLTEPVTHMGRIVFPAGSTVEGRITEIHGGRRFRGAAMIHLQAQTIVLPDGTRMPLHAAVIDTDQYARTRTDAEGNIIRKDHVMQTVAEFTIAAGGGAAAGGLIAGAPGALIGAGVGAGVGTVVWLKQDRQTTLPNDTLLVLSLTSPTFLDGTVRQPELVRALPATRTTEADLPAESAPAPRYSESFVPAR